jgi:hypothetical protein
MLRQRQRLLGHSVPPRVERAVAVWAPGPILNFVMDRLFAHRFACDRSDERRAGTGFANWLLYLRSHLLRMPLPMLVRHLSVKALRRVRDRFERRPEDNEDI